MLSAALRCGFVVRLRHHAARLVKLGKQPLWCGHKQFSNNCGAPPSQNRPHAAHPLPAAGLSRRVVADGPGHCCDRRDFFHRRARSLAPSLQSPPSRSAVLAPGFIEACFGIVDTFRRESPVAVRQREIEADALPHMNDRVTEGTVGFAMAITCLSAARHLIGSLPRWSVLRCGDQVRPGQDLCNPDHQSDFRYERAGVSRSGGGAG
jgi:hypothetical protein